MTASQRWPGLALAAACAMAAAPGARAQCVEDQAQVLCDSGTSARTLPGYTIWQSFTPSLSGTLCQIDMGFFNDMSGRGTLSVLQGDGTAGSLLFETVVPIVAANSGCVRWNSWPISGPSITAGSRYTFRITPDASTLPDPYGVSAKSGDAYPDGTMGLDDPSGSYEMPFDMAFRTHVGSSTAPAVVIFRDPSPVALDDPSNEIARVSASPHDDAAPPRALLLCYAVDDPDPADELLFVERLGASGVRLRW